MIPDRLKQYDFRSNLICDPDNPILIQKAWRDRFSSQSHWGAGYGGTAYLSRPNSEDALTWNVFRTLQHSGEPGLSLVAEIFGVHGVELMLFWGCDVHDRSDVQQLLNILIRITDGRLAGTMTEADLVIVARHTVVFCECKLNNNSQASPWAARGDGAQKRMDVYRQTLPELSEIAGWQDVYQLIRQYVYASLLAYALGKRPLVVPVVNQAHLRILEAYYEPLRRSGGMIARVFQPLVTWQDVRVAIGASRLQSAPEIVRKLDQTLGSAH